MVSLSYVKYDVAMPKPVDLRREVVAILLNFEGFRKMPEQGEVDALYQIISPSTELYEDYSVVAPFDVREAKDRGDISLISRKALMEGLNENLGVSLVCLSPSAG